MDPQVLGDVRDRSLRLEHETNSPLAQLIGVLPPSGHRRSISFHQDGAWHRSLQLFQGPPGRDQVTRVIREHGLAGKLRGSKKRTTIPDEAAVERARDLLQRDFTATRPNEKCVADLTYIRTWNGFVYLAFILDCYSRRIVGGQLATHMPAELVLDALEMANGLRRPGAGLIATRIEVRRADSIGRRNTSWWRWCDDQLNPPPRAQAN
jgi:transposase InsO family protein